MKPNISTFYQNIEILYEDNHLLVITKPGGMLSQSDITGDEDIQTLLKRYLKEKYQKPGNVFLALVQRLDRPTSGLMVLARTSKASSRLSEQIRNRSVIKKYMAVVESSSVSSGELIHYLKKNEESKTSEVFAQNVPGSKKAVTGIEHIATNGGFSLLSATLHTGRFHQIRAQLSASGMPVAGDLKYGAKMRLGGVIALTCHHLSFEHPTRKETMTYSAKLPNSHPWTMFRDVTTQTPRGGKPG